MATEQPPVPCEFRDPKVEHVPAEKTTRGSAERSWHCRNCGTELRPSTLPAGGFVAVPGPLHAMYDRRLVAPA